MNLKRLTYKKNVGKISEVSETSEFIYIVCFVFFKNSKYLILWIWILKIKISILNR